MRVVLAALRSGARHAATTALVSVRARLGGDRRLSRRGGLRLVRLRHILGVVTNAAEYLRRRSLSVRGVLKRAAADRAAIVRFRGATRVGGLRSRRCRPAVLARSARVVGRLGRLMPAQEVKPPMPVLRRVAWSGEWVGRLEPSRLLRAALGWIDLELAVHASRVFGREGRLSGARGIGRSFLRR